VATDRRFTGHPVSRVLRRVFETKEARQFLGVNLLALTIVSGTMAPGISAFISNPEEELTIPNSQIIQLTTEETIRVPLDSFVVSQGYHTFHRAVDLNEIAGAPVYPIMEGIVEEVNYSRFSYGNHVIIDHGSGFESLYAHLGKIVVKKDEEVDKNTVIGTVGSTGLSTGPHLHLEVYDHGQPFNPLTILK
jgi:murein DD-endopeptidase MepM/ murein hydrolase activator NlpD